MVAHKLQGRTKLYGLDISIENAKGSVRRWYDPHGKETGHTKMHFDYGYIRGTKGTDGDHVDVYVGPDLEATKVYIVDQMKKPSTPDDGKDWKQFDEQKVMLAFKNAAEAKFAYLKQYDDHRFFGGMKEMSVEDFKAKVLHKDNHGQKIANGDMIQYFMDHPEKLKEKKERDAKRKKHASLLTELNLVKLSLGEDLVLPKVANGDLLGEGTPGISTLPAVTNYSQASMSRQERDQGKREVKTAADNDRTSRIADRVDDVGIGVLAAPYAAGAAGHMLSKAKNPKLQLAGRALEKFGPDSAFGHSHARELAGLAMVAPGVTHSIAKGINKVLPAEKQADQKHDPNTFKAVQAEMERRGLGGCEADEVAERVVNRKMKLEKIATRLYPDFEYRTEQEKTALLEQLGRIGGQLVRHGEQAVAGAKALVAGGAPGMANRAQAAFQSARLGREVSPAVMQRGRQMEASLASRNAGGRPTILDPRGATMAEAGRARPALAPKAPPNVAPPSPAPGGVPTPVTTTAAAPAAQRRSLNPLTPRNLALGGVAAAGGLATYGGYKGIQTASNILSSPAESPLAPAAFYGPGRAI